MTKGSGGGISLIDGYTVDRTLLSGDESGSLMLALQMLKATKYPDVNPLLEKLGAVFKNKTASDWIDIDFEPWENDPNEKNCFSDIKEAILGHRVIDFDYINAQGERNRRAVEPARLLFRGQTWYLQGYCRKRCEARTFRVSRIKCLTVTGETFEERALKPEANHSTGVSPQFTPIKLRFQPQVVYRIYDYFDDRMIVRNPDGTYTVEVTWPEDEWVYGYILSFGCYAEVLAPAHIRCIISERLKKSLEYYQ